MEARLDHVGVLVADVGRAAKMVAALGHAVGAAQVFPAEGTREVYVGAPNATGRLLLLEAIGCGAYADAVAARGVGLHHLGIATASVEDLVRRVAGTGWYLHPRSLDTLRASRTVWLSRPGVPALIEVFEAADSVSYPSRSVVSRIELPSTRGKPRLLDALGIPSIVASADGRVWVTLGTQRLDPATLGA